MKLSEQGLALLKQLEGFRAHAYQDAGKGIWTIGYGHTGLQARAGATCTEALATEWLKVDVAGAEHWVNRLVKVPLTQPQFDALVIFTYNVGSGGLAKSDLLREINAGKPPAETVPLFMHYAGHGLLTTRREAEQKLFLQTA